MGPSRQKVISTLLVRNGPRYDMLVIGALMIRIGFLGAHYTGTIIRNPPK